MWFLFPLWSGKESQWSKWESSFSTLRAVRGHTKEGHFLSGGWWGLCQTEQDINIKNKHGEQLTENLVERKRHPALDGGTNLSPQSDAHRSCRGRWCCFIYHAGAVFASRLIRLWRNRVNDCCSLLLSKVATFEDINPYCFVISAWLIFILINSFIQK